jgi:MFS family permease
MQPSNSPTNDSGFKALLKNRPFLSLWSGQILSQIADKVFFVLLIALLEVLLKNFEADPTFANSMRSTLMLTITLPAILFGSIAGIVVDRFSKKQILVNCNFIRALLTLAIPLLPQRFVVLLTLSFIESVLTQFFAPAEQAAIPLLVDRKDLISANALFTTTIMGSLIVGFAIGEPLLTWAKGFGPHGPELLIGLVYLCATLLLNSMPDREEGLSVRNEAHPWSDFKAGLKYLRQERSVSSALIQLTILYSVFAALMVLAIDLAEKIGLKPTQFGFLLAAAGVGMVFGAGLLGHWGSKLHHQPLPLIGFLTIGAVLGVFSFIQSLWLTLTLCILLGIGAAFIGVPMQTLVQEQTPEAMRGKVFGFQNNLVNIALSLPLAVAGPLADWNLRWTLLGMSILVALGGSWAWRRSRQVLQDAI